MRVSKLKVSALFLGIAFLSHVSLVSAAEKAPEIRKASTWINSSPLSIKELRGKVVVVDFWAFDCAPCIEAVPRLIALQEKYAERGLVIVGVHTPRTEKERNVANLRDAMTRLGIRYPVVADESQKIWRDYRCDLWPTQFVIDPNGVIQYVHGGAGRYEELETTVEKLLTKTSVLQPNLRR
jgi:thiol-disulfide isomerase/thioredoxin